MNGELSNGLPSLATVGNRIVIAATGQPILLRGVNRSGLEWAEPDEDGFSSAAGISRAEIEFIVKDWNCNIIRLPLNQDWALNGRGERSADDYLNDLDRVVHWASRAGAYTLLDLQWLDADRPFGATATLLLRSPTGSLPISGICLPAAIVTNLRSSTISSTSRMTAYPTTPTL